MILLLFWPYSDMLWIPRNTLTKGTHPLNPTNSGRLSIELTVFVIDTSPTHPWKIVVQVIAAQRKHQSTICLLQRIEKCRSWKRSKQNTRSNNHMHVINGFKWLILTSTFISCCFVYHSMNLEYPTWNGMLIYF